MAAGTGATGVPQGDGGAQQLMATPLSSQPPLAAGNRAASSCWPCRSCPPSGSPPSAPASAPSTRGPAGHPGARPPAHALPRTPAVPGRGDAVRQRQGTGAVSGWGRVGDVPCRHGARDVVLSLRPPQSCTPTPRHWWGSCVGPGTLSGTRWISPSSPGLCPSSWARSTGTSSLPASAGMPQVPTRPGCATPWPCGDTPPSCWWLGHPYAVSLLSPSCPHRCGCGRGAA